MNPPSASNYMFRNYYGELNRIGPHGKGIKIFKDGHIYIQYWNNEEPAPGNYIRIFSDGEFKVGEFYLKDGEMHRRGALYCLDCTATEFDE